ncbi:hypothetical protein GIB67_004962 [Kingdonia uniflora]|uniref:Uncharacterized protein n=1 Tax=Kingdonia uniflora TaxID=39325 RepID=A0A7J7NN11_9MAGN|nr:hypothetical protein GIB67_004962 [Kingdonia uniflora]
MVLPAEEVVVSMRRRAIVTEDTKDKVRLERFAAKLELSKVGIFLSVAGAGLTFKSNHGSGIMAYRGQIRLRMELPLRRLVKEVLNFWEVAHVQINGNFYEMMKVIEGMNVKLAGEGRNLIKWFDIVTFYSRKASQNPGTYHIQCHPEKPWFFDLCSTGQGWNKDLLIVSGNFENEDEDDPYKWHHRVYNESLGSSTWDNPVNHIDNLLKASEDWGTGEEDTQEEDEEMTEEDRQEQAVAKKSSMVKLWEDDPDEASKEVKWYMFQQTDAWVRTCSKAMKSVKAKLRQARENVDLSRGMETSLMSELAVCEREKAKQKVRLQGQYDGECKVTMRLKNFIDEKGYDPDTLEPYPVSPEFVEAPSSGLVNGRAVGVSNEAAEVADGGASVEQEFNCEHVDVYFL